MKCDRKWYNDGRLEREYAEQRARDEAQRQLEMRAHPQPCPCMLCSPRYDLVAQLPKPIPTAVVRSACGQFETRLRPRRIVSDPQPPAHLTPEQNGLLRDTLYGVLGRDYEGPLVGLRCTGVLGTKAQWADPVSPRDAEDETEYQRSNASDRRAIPSDD